MPNKYVLMLAMVIVLMLALLSQADASEGKKVRLCDARGAPCVTITLPPRGKCREFWGYWICHGRPKK